jgi:outer membrane receptor for ferrienterochelin and colicins
MKSIHLTARIVGVWIVCAGLAWGESQFCVTVRDPAGLAVPGARIAIKPLAAAAVLRGVTGEDGRLCQTLAPGGYLVRAEKDQFAGAADSLTVTPDRPSLERELVLSITPVASQMEVTASRLPASLTEAPLPVLQIDRRRGEALGARGLNDALQEQAEVVTFAGGAHAKGGSTNVQGAVSKDVEILIDGEPLVGRVAGYIDLNQLDSSIVEAVEIKSGASAMTYGLQGQGGAINIITRRAGTGASAAVESGYGSFNTALERLEGGFSAGGWAAFAAGSLQRSLGYDTDPVTAVVTQSPGRTRNLFSNLYAPRMGVLSAGITALWMDQTYWGYDSDTTGVYDFDRPKGRLALLPRATIALNGENLIGLRARHLYYRSAEEIFYRTPGTFTHTASTQQADGAEGEWTLMHPSGFRTFVGASYSHEDIKGTSLGTADGNADRSYWSQIASGEYTFWHRLKVQAGYRADHDSVFGNKLSPQWSAAFRVAPALSVSASLTRGFRAPDFNELYLNNTHAGGRVRVLGNTDVSPEQAWYGSAGVLYAPSRRIRLEGRLFENRLEDMIQATFVAREGIASVYRYLNVGEARIRGAYVSAETVVASNLRLTGAYQYLHTRDVAAGSPLEYSPAHRGTLSAIYSNVRHGLLIGFFGNLTGQTFVTGSGDAEDYMRSFELFGLNVQKDLRRGLALRMTFRNLSDNTDSNYRVTSPFGVEASLRYQFGSAR